MHADLATMALANTKRNAGRYSPEPTPDGRIGAPSM